MCDRCGLHHLLQHTYVKFVRLFVYQTMDDSCYDIFGAICVGLHDTNTMQSSYTTISWFFMYNRIWGDTIWNHSLFDNVWCMCGFIFSNIIDLPYSAMVYVHWRIDIYRLL